MRKILAGLAGIVVVSIVHQQAAHAVTCDTLTLSDLSEDVILGEAGGYLCGQNVGCVFLPDSTPHLGACVTTPDGEETFYMLDCTIDNVVGDKLSLSTRGGDDRVAVLKDAHTTGWLDLLPAGGNTGAIFCGDHGDTLAPWHPEFEFGLSVSLGTGSDLFHGSDRADVVTTNANIFFNGVISSPADQSTDQVCGWGGNDTLSGDRDDDFRTAEDLLDGGAGTDSCDGDPWVNGDDWSDVSQSCETSGDAWATSGFFSCAASDDPLHDWD